MKRSIAAAAMIPMAVMVLPAGAWGAPKSAALPSGASQGGSVMWSGTAPRKLLLSRDARAGRGDVRLALKRVKGGLRVTIPRAAHPGVYRVLACARRCRALRGRFAVLPGFRHPHPVNVTPVLQADRAVRQTVGSAGGELTTAAADGTRYTLTVPAGALTGDTDLEMTPVASARKLPFQRLGGAVQLGPEDVHFLVPATLRIQPPKPVSARRAVPTLWAGAGRDLHLEPATVRGGAVTFELFHFSSPGYVLGTNRQYDDLASNTPSRRENWARQNLERVIREKRDGGQFAGAATPAIYIYGNEVARPALEAALEAVNPSQEAMGAAIGLELAFERQGELAGVADDASIKALGDVLRGLVKKLIAKSERLADERCQRGDPTQALYILAAERVRQLTGDDSDAGTDATLATLDELTRCLSFEIVFDSEISVTTRNTYSGGGGGTFNYRVVSRVPIKAEPLALQTEPSTGALTYADFSGQRSYPSYCGTDVDTPLRAPADPATLTVGFYALHLYPPRNPDPGVELSLRHSGPSETVHQSDGCNGGEGEDFTETQWADAFRWLHINEKPDGDRDPFEGDAFLLTHFSRGQGFLFARKEYTQTDARTFNPRHNAREDYEAVEHTIIDVVHRPIAKGVATTR